MENLQGVIGSILRRLLAGFMLIFENSEMMAQFYGMKVVARCLTKNSPSRFKNMQISLLTLLVLLLQTFSAMAQQPEVQSAARDAVEWRHHIHENPELSFEEYKTSNYVADLLASFGHIEVLRPTKTSVVGILRGGKPGKTVGFRADMDALPVQELSLIHI